MKFRPDGAGIRLSRTIWHSYPKFKRDLSATCSGLREKIEDGQLDKTQGSGCRARMKRRPQGVKGCPHHPAELARSETVLHVIACL